MIISLCRPGADRDIARKVAGRCSSFDAPPDSTRRATGCGASGDLAERAFAPPRQRPDAMATSRSAIAQESDAEPQAPAGHRSDQAPLPGQRRVPSADLFRGALEMEIVHHGQVYRLRQTALGKLILTK